MIIRKNNIEAFINAIRTYLSPVNIGGVQVPLYTSYESQESNNNDYPQFYIKNVQFLKDSQRATGGFKYVYEYNEVQTEDAERKLREKPYIVPFMLEYIDRNAKTYFEIIESVNRKFNREPYLMLEYTNITDKRYFFIKDQKENDISKINHHIWMIELELYLDDSESIDSVPINTDIEFNYTNQELL